MKYCLPIGFLLLSSSAFASLKSVHVTQTAVGTNSGADCANANAVTFFNTAGNWGAGATQIGQDTTVHLCGIITTALSFHGRGATGHPITLLWETGATISLPTCGESTPCVNGNSNSYLVMDGGTNGSVQNTANGSMLPNQSISYGIVAPGCDGCEIKNLTVKNLYVHTPPNKLVSITGNGSTATGSCSGKCSFVSGVTARINGNSVAGFNNVPLAVLTASGSTFTFASLTIGTGTGGIVGDISGDNTGTRGIVIGGSNWKVHHNVLHNIAWALWNYYEAGTDVGGRIYNNDIHNIDHAVAVVGWGPHDVGPFYIYNNHIHDFQNWDNPGGHWHHDGIHVYTTNSGGCANVTELWIYNNLFDGDAGDNMTGHVFLEGGTCSNGTPWTRPVSEGGTGRAIVFNNVFIGTPNRIVNGYIQIGNSSGSEVYNNTMLCSNNNHLCFLANNAQNYKFKNNFVSGSSNTLIAFAGTTSFAVPGDLNNNVYTNCVSPGHNCFSWHGIVYTDNFTTWQAASSGDASSDATLGGTGGLSSTGIPLVGSPVIGAGANLASVGIADLNFDRVGTPRPLSTGWTIGAYNFSWSNIPAPPSGLIVVVK